MIKGPENVLDVSRFNISTIPPDFKDVCFLIFVINIHHK